jgi:hypothetical protein
MTLVTPSRMRPRLDHMIGRLARKPLSWVIILALAAGGVAGLYWLQPWKLFTSSTVNEALPGVDSQPSASTGATRGTATPGTATPGISSAPVNTLLASGMLATHAHETSGSAKLVRLADGRVQLLLENLATSDGPDLRVWLTDQSVLSGRSGWSVFDDGRYVEVGTLKANKGNQIYDVPSDTSLDGLISVTIWCKRFSVSFGAAELHKT